jgi:hypothetical protein
MGKFAHCLLVFDELDGAAASAELVGERPAFLDRARDRAQEPPRRRVQHRLASVAEAEWVTASAPSSCARS